MDPNGDYELLRHYVERQSEAAFTELVRRHIGLVCSTAARQVGDLHLAQDITQAVFIILARKASRLPRETIVSAWLYRTARFASTDALKTRARRQKREREAAAMEITSPDDSAWRQVAPLLDEAMARLGERDRDAVILRYFDGKTLTEVASVLGTTPDSARMRVNRAVEKLRSFFAKRGVVISAAVIGGLLSASSAQATPMITVTSVASAALLKGASGSASALAIMNGTLKAMAWIKLKIGAAAASVVLLLAGTGAVLVEFHSPNARDLLKQVAEARKTIASGEVEFEISRYFWGRPFEGTNHVRLSAVFDHENRRFESARREYAYVLMAPDAGAVTDAKMRELNLTQEAAVQAGLLAPFESHHVSAYDGKVLMDYSEINGGPFQVRIDDPKKGSVEFLFDPRTFGLTPNFFPEDTIDSVLCLNARSVRLIGKEMVDNAATWHVKPEFDTPFGVGFWIDVNHPTHVVKVEYNGNTVISRFDPANPDDPIPVEVDITDFFGPDRERVDCHYVRLGRKWNVPVDASSWTLAGLKMGLGTWVVDYRNNQSLGYWNGTSLSDNPPASAAHGGIATNPRSESQLLAMALHDPKSPLALDAATWVLLNGADGSGLRQSADLLLREHVLNTNMGYVCEGLSRKPQACSEDLLRAMMDRNPSLKARATACFALATLLKRRANETGDARFAREAEQLFERAATDFGQVESEGTSLADLAKPQLAELNHLGVGKPAPETEGEDLDGRSMKLSDYSGKVVVLVFWGTWCGPCMAMVPEERDLAQRMVGKPVALVGVNSDGDVAKARAAVEREKMSWRSFRDRSAAGGRIAASWNVHSWPTVFVLDANGVIRYRDLRGQALVDAVEALIRERK